MPWLLVATLAGGAPVGAEEVMLGRVLSVTADSVTVALGDDSAGRRLTLPLDEVGGRGLVPGSLVRVWSGDASAVRMTPIGGGVADRTGVRARLSRGAGRGGMGGGRGGR